MQNESILNSLRSEFSLRKTDVTPQGVSSWVLSKTVFLLVVVILYITIRSIIASALIKADWYWPINRQLVEDGAFELIFWILITIIGLTSVSRWFYPVRLSSNVIWALICLYFVYVLEEHYWNDFIFINSTLINFNYASTLILLPFIELALRIKYALSSTQATPNTSQFIENRPAQYDANAETTRNNIINILTKEIKKSSFTDAYSIGIIGDWGIGKTSFVKALEENLKSSAIIIHFSPWLSLGKNSLLQNFSNSLKEKLGVYDRTLELNVSKYIKSLINLENNNTSSLIEAFEFISGHQAKSKNTEHEEINKAIQKIGKRVIVIIDDLDRLDVLEITEVLKLIRNTANFTNIIYITCYDKVYLLHALQQFNKRNLNIILDKFFDLEIPISPIREEDLIAKIEKEFLSKHNISPAIAAQIVGFIQTSKPFTQFREVNRFLTSLQINFELYGSRLYVYDFFVFEIIKVRYPFLPTILWRNRHVFFQEEISPSLIVLTVEPQNKNKVILIEHLLKLEENEYQRHFLSTEDHLFIKETLNTLFAKQSRHGLAIDEPHAFPKYFYYEIPDVTAFNLDINSILKEKKYKNYEYFREPYNSKKEADIYQVLNEFVKTNQDFDQNSFIDFLLFIVDWADGQISPEIILSEYAKMEESVRDSHFVRSITSNASSEAQLFSRIRFLNAIIREVIDDQPKKEQIISLKTLIELNNDLFKKELNQSEAFTNETFSAFLNQLIHIEPGSRKIILNPDSIKQLREFINKFSAGYLDLNIRGAMSPNYDLEFVFEPFTFQLFADKKDFTDFISQSEYPERLKTAISKYLNEAQQNEYSMYQFKLDRSELGQLPVEFKNAWLTIPNNYKTETRFVSTSFLHQFKNQEPPLDYPDRNDDYFREIFALNILSIRIEITPENTEFWRFGFSFIKNSQYPNIKGGRHADKDKADVHITVGDDVQGQWINKNEIKIKEYNITPQTADQRQINYANSTKITLSLSVTDKRNCLYTVEISSDGTKISEKTYDLTHYQHFVISAWCDRRQFVLSSKINLVQYVPN